MPPNIHRIDSALHRQQDSVKIAVIRWVVESFGPTENVNAVFKSTKQAILTEKSDLLFGTRGDMGGECNLEWPPAFPL